MQTKVYVVLWLKGILQKNRSQGNLTAVLAVLGRVLLTVLLS